MAEAQLSRVGDQAKDYFRLALTLIQPAAPSLLAIGGLSGTGKSVLARNLALELQPAPGAVVLRSDVERKALYGGNQYEPLPDYAHAPEMTSKVYEVLRDKTRRLTRTGHFAIIDAVFARADERRAIAEIAEDSRIKFAGLFLVAKYETELCAKLGDGMKG